MQKKPASDKGLDLALWLSRSPESAFVVRLQRPWEKGGLTLKKISEMNGETAFERELDGCKDSVTVSYENQICLMAESEIEQGYNLFSGQKIFIYCSWRMSSRDTFSLSRNIRIDPNKALVRTAFGIVGIVFLSQDQEIVVTTAICKVQPVKKSLPKLSALLWNCTCVLSFAMYWKHNGFFVNLHTYFLAVPLFGNSFHTV